MIALPLARELIGSERLRHAAIAILLAVVVAATTILRPLDITVWSLQAKLFDHSPTSEFVFVEVEKGPDSQASSENRRLLRTIRRLEHAGVARIFIDMPIQRSNSLSIDAELRSELVRLADKVVLTRAVREDFAERGSVGASDRFFQSGMRVVSNDYKTDFLGYVWGVKASYSNGTIELPTLWNAMVPEVSRKEIYPDYAIDTDAIPRYNLNRTPSLSEQETALFGGKTVVLGPQGNVSRLVRIPGRGVVPPSLIHIMAAETAARESGQILSWLGMVGGFGLSLVVGLIACRGNAHRKVLYVLWTTALLILVVVTAQLGIRAEFAGPLALTAVYSACRLLVRFKRRHLFLEPRSKLPNFVALQRDLGDEHVDRTTAVVVAKIARLDAIFATLTPADQGRYLRQLASRLALGDAGSRIYYDGGKYFAFAVSSEKYQDLQGHLEGLRAVASQSITVSHRVLDVSMTIGVDRSSDKSVSSRLSSAIAAADQAREAYRPVFVISDFAAESEEWDYSLQARLESALSEDRISIKLQPQADLRSGRIVGVEALARWVDEERGEISPARFILQCERVGRLDDLTKRVLLKSLRAAETLRSYEHEPKVSINVSAIQFVDSRIADLIEMNVAAHSADPAKLTIEVTETARIEDFSAARAVFEQIKRLGVSFSMDDFGVASANLEAMFELPFDEIKIDQLFVQQIHRSRTARAIVSNVARLASDAGLTSVAEGIEDRETFALLRDMGCDLGQGYYIARPVTVGEIQEMLTLQRDGLPLRNKVN